MNKVRNVLKLLNQRDKVFNVEFPIQSMKKRQVTHFFSILLLAAALMMSLQIMKFGSPTGYVVLNTSIEENRFNGVRLTGMAGSDDLKKPSLGLALAVLAGLVLVFLVAKYVMHHHSNVLGSKDVGRKSSGDRKLIKLNLED